MEEEDDDLYDPAEPDLHASNGTAKGVSGEEVKMEELEEGEEEEEEEEEEVEEDESDSDDFNIITEKPAGQEPEPEPPSKGRHVSIKNVPSRTASADLSAKPSTPTIPIKSETSPTTAKTLSPLSGGRPGSSYPALHTSTLDVNANPIHPATGKPITETDLDADFGGAEADKPWRKPGTDMTDFFNYGFDEFTWASYCLKQRSVRKGVEKEKDQQKEMMAFLNSAGGAAVPGMPPMPGMPQQQGGAVAQQGGEIPGMPGMPGMPTMEQMASIMNAMGAQGLDVTKMDEANFAQHMQAYMSGAQQQGGVGQSQGQMGYGGQEQGYGPQVGGQQQMGYGSGYNQRGGTFGGRGRGGRNRW